MAKENPRILARRERRRLKVMERKNKQRSETQKEKLIKPLENLNPSSYSSPSPTINPLEPRSPLPSSLPLPRFSLSSPEPSPKEHRMSHPRSFSDPKSPRALLKNPPVLPPLPPSPQLLRRAISDPAPLRMLISDSQGVKKVSKNLLQMNKVFDEIPNENGSKLARTWTRTCSTRKDDDGGERKMMRGGAVAAERMEGDWIMIIINCPCGSKYQLLITEVEKKCYYKLV